MKKSLMLIVSVFCCLLFAGCQNSLFQSVTSKFSEKKPEEMTPSQVETINTAQIDKDLQSVYARNWKEEFSEKRTANSIQQVAFERPQYQSRQPNSQLTISELLNRGEAAKRSGNSSEAASFYHAILKKDRNHPTAHHQLAVLADKQRDFRTSEYHYLAALRQKGDNPDLYSDLGYSYLMQNKLQAAESYLQQALKLRPSHQLALNNLGILYGRAGDHNRALEMFRRTGTEQDAQQKLAALIPPKNRQQNNYPPQNNQDTRIVNRRNQQQTQQPEPIKQVDNIGSTPHESVLELRKRMDKIRRDAIAKRNGGQSHQVQLIPPAQPPHQHKLIPPARLPNQQRTIPLIQDNYPPATRQEQYPPRNYQQYQQPIDPRLQQQMKTGRLPDSRLNDAFRAIEHTNQNGANRYHNSYTPAEDKGYQPSSKRQAHRLLVPEERERRDVNPLDSMKEWNPQTEVNRQKVDVIESSNYDPRNTTRHQQSPRYSNSRPSNELESSSYLPKKYQQQSAQQQAARAGMSGGLGDMLPTEDNQHRIEDRQQTVIPAAHRSFPGTDSRIGGLEFGPAKPYGHQPQQQDVQHSDYHQSDEGQLEAERLRSAIYWKDPRQVHSDYGKSAGEHRQQYNMRQSQQHSSRLINDRAEVNRDHNRAAQQLSREHIPLGNGALSPQAGQYYGPNQYKYAAPSNNEKSSRW